jgi:hypothetical protein
MDRSTGTTAPQESCSGMSTIADESSLIFFAEGDDATELLDLLEEEGEAAVVDHIVGSKLEDIDTEDTPEPEEDDDEVFEHDDGYILVFNPRIERVWLYEREETDDEL